MVKSGGSISNEAQENLATCTSEDGRPEVGTEKVFTWTSKVASKVVSVTLPDRNLLPLKIITKFQKACSLFKLFKAAYFS